MIRSWGPETQDPGSTTPPAAIAGEIGLLEPAALMELWHMIWPKIDPLPVSMKYMPASTRYIQTP